MDWLELKLTIPNECTEMAENIANMVVPYGFYLEDYSDLEQGALEIAHIDLIDEELIKRDRTKSIIHLYINPDENIEDIINYITARFSAEGIPFEYDNSSVSDSDWADNWKKFFKTTEVGERLVIRPTWEEYENTENKTVLSMDPGAAFGTGTHATTRMCLQLLDKYVENGDTMLDIGCGSGILSIAAALLGAKKAIGVDIDSVAVKVATENAKINKVDGITEYIVGDLAEKVTGKFKIVCANIVADIVMKLTEGVAEYMNDDSLFITSGIIDIRKDEVIEKLHACGFEIVETVNENNWYCFMAKLKK